MTGRCDACEAPTFHLTYEQEADGRCAFCRLGIDRRSDNFRHLITGGGP